MIYFRIISGNNFSIILLYNIIVLKLKKGFLKNYYIFLQIAAFMTY